jgi:alanine racemase
VSTDGISPIGGGGRNYSDLAMTVRLTIRRPSWRSHVAQTAAQIDGLVPVVKGNGYGFGRHMLMPVAAELSRYVAVGTVHELGAAPPNTTEVVLTPAAAPPPTTNPVLTVGAERDVEALAGWHGQVLLKLQSSMRRYGCTPSEVAHLTAAARNAGLDVIGYSLHLPLAGDEQARSAEADGWLAHLDPTLPVWLSHLQPATFCALQQSHRARQFLLRVGTALWLGDKAMLHLQTRVLHTEPTHAGDVAGYRHQPITAPGTLVLAGGGSAHGIAALDGGLSPFHFARTRLVMLESPHMHTTMLFVPTGSPTPQAGDWLDLQRPLIATTVDELRWID